MSKNRIHIILLLAFCFIYIKANSQCIDNGNYWIESWTSCEVSSNPNAVRADSYWVLFEFSEPQAISTTHIWNANRMGESGHGAKTVFIDVSTDGISWTQVGAGSSTWPQATELENYIGFDGPNLQSFGFIEKILITIVDNHDNSACVSISELRFDIDPTACYGELDDCGVCDGPGLVTYFEDADGDGLGNPDSSIESCDIPSGFVENNEDNCDNGLIGWDDIGYIFSNNGCTGCHGGPAPLGNLNLTTFEGIAAGGDLCGSNILTGTVLVDIINISNYDGCSTTIPFPSMNERVGDAIDSDEIQLIQTWIDDGALNDCNCPTGSPDSDSDGTCDASDLCNGLDDALIGTSCDDGDPCTISDVITSNCTCVGLPALDSDSDGVCDVLDLAINDPCTADGIIGYPEPADWVNNENNDCDLDGVLVSEGDLNDFNECINHLGASLKPECACPGNETIGGGTLAGSLGGGSEHNSVGVPDGAFTNQFSLGDYLDLEYPYMELGTEICFTVGIGSPAGGIQFEVNERGFYRFPNPEPSLPGFTPQEICFPTFMAGPQQIRVSRYIFGTVKIDGSTYSYCPCTDSDPNNLFASCACPNGQTEVAGTYVDSYGITNAQEGGGASDGILTGRIHEGDSLTLSYSASSENYEICIDVLFSVVFGRVSFDLNNENITITNPAGIGENGQIQNICFKTNSNESQTLIIKDVGSGYIQVDGSGSVFCNPCAADGDSDGVCDVDDLCLTGDDSLDQDGDGIPDACDNCNGNIIGTSCDDNDNCTIDDIYDSNCNCAGIPLYYESVVGLQGPLDLQTIDSISLSGDFEILSDGYFRAGKQITIHPEFETKESITLEIQIEQCSPGN